MVNTFFTFFIKQFTVAQKVAKNQLDILIAGAHVTSPAKNTSGVQQARANAQLHRWPRHHTS
jgi:hypothetical protein